MVDKLNSEKKPIAIDVAELYDISHRTIVQFVNNVNRKVAGDNFSNLKFLITDGATYMLKAGLVLKEKNDKLRHAILNIVFRNKFTNFTHL